VQKHIYDRDFLLLTNQLKELILKISTWADLDHLLVYLDNTLYYIMKKAEISDKVKFKEVLNEIPLVKENSIMSTMAEQWVSEGFQRGMQQGVQEGIKIAAFKMLQAGMCCNEISKITGLSKIEIKDLDKKHECNH
jgi:predicted transposase/invertase (TIGR01784 family)